MRRQVTLVDPNSHQKQLAQEQMQFHSATLILLRPESQNQYASRNQQADSAAQKNQLVVEDMAQCFGVSVFPTSMARSILRSGTSQTSDART